jgi:hypothetical protein
MANTITAGNATNNGMAFVSDSTGTLNILTGTGSGTTALSIDASQNITFSGNVIGAVKAGTAVASTSGTSIDFTSIPSTVKRITVMFNGVSTNGSSIPLIQLGDSGGIENTGYSAFAAASTSAGFFGASTAGFPVGTSSISALGTLLYGSIIFTNIASNDWVGQGAFYASNGYIVSVSGAKSTSATLDRLRITTASPGTDVFDAGSINILYE